jgi:uncharacterized protein (TIGR01777 family)
VKVVVAGGSGLLGNALVTRLIALGHDVVVLTRDASGQAAQNGPRVRQVEWQADGETGRWAIEVASADAIVNLAGAGIGDRRWTSARKALIRSSRVLPTRSLVAAVREASKRPSVFIQGSAVGYYGTARDGQLLDESFPPGDDFLGNVCVAWEAEAYPVKALGCRLVVARTGIVLAGSGGVLARMKLPFQFFAGGPVASGEQYISWIHVDDWVNVIVWALTNGSIEDVLNTTAPEPVTNRAFSAALGRALHRPSWLPVPAFALRILFGDMADSLLVRGQRAVPKRALENGFTFAHPSVDEAMAHAIGR